MPNLESEGEFVGCVFLAGIAGFAALIKQVARFNFSGPAAVYAIEKSAETGKAHYVNEEIGTFVVVTSSEEI